MTLQNQGSPDGATTSERFATDIHRLPSLLSLFILLFSAVLFLLYATVTVAITRGFGFDATGYILGEQLSLIYTFTIGMPLLVVVLVLSISIDVLVSGIRYRNMFIVSIVWVLTCLPFWYVGRLLMIMAVMTSM